MLLLMYSILNFMWSSSLLIAGMIIFGSLNTIVRKAQMVTCSGSSFPADPVLAKECSDPDEEPFYKPWMGNLFMFVGETMLFVAVSREKRSRDSAGDEISKPPLPYRYLAIPASLDVLGSGLSGVSMLFISASVWQMLRGSMIIYTAVLSVVYLKRRLTFQHTAGLMLATLGLTLVGLSAYFDSPEASEYRTLFRGTVLGEYTEGGSSSLVVFGILLTVLSQLCSAMQVVVEESMLTSASQYESPSPARVVAFEGLWGLLIMVIVLLVMQWVPGADHGSYENSVDSIQKMSNNMFLVFLIGLYCVSIALFNQCGMTVSKELSSLYRTLIDSLRALVVWGAQLVMFYEFGSSTYGTPWTANSWMQLCGFIFLLLGTLVYNEVIVIFKTPTTQEAASLLGS